MSSELPPTEYFNGISFNPDFYTSGSDNITTEEAKNLIIAYNTSSTDTITTLNTTNINSIGSTLYIGPNLTTNSVIIIGSDTHTQTTIKGTAIGLLGNSTVLGNLTTTGVINAGVGVLSGNTSFSIVSASFTIPSTINRDYYIFCNANATAYTITLPTRLVNQIIQLRNFSGRTLSITAPTTTPATAIYPTGFTTPFTTTWTGFLNNTVQTFYCDGTNWLGF
jgi:hypothetical protein